MQINFSQTITQITADLLGKKPETNCSVVTVLASVGLTEKQFGYQAISKTFPPVTKWLNKSHSGNIEMPKMKIK